MSILKLLLKTYIAIIAIFLLGRIFLVGLYFDDLQSLSINEFFKIFIYGLRMDTIVTSVLLLIPLIILTTTKSINERFNTTTFKYYTLIVISSLIFIEVATFPFIDQYNVRPNYIFVEYISFPKQIFNMIVEDYLFELILAISLIIVFIITFLKKFNTNLLSQIALNSMKLKLVLAIGIFLLLTLGARSSFGSRPANISDALWSSNRTANEITKNSLHSILTDIYRNIKYRDNENIVNQFGKIDIKKAIVNVDNLLGIPAKSTLNLNRINKSHFKNADSKNIVIILVESLGARFVEAVGGEEGLTPNINTLAKEGLLFTNAYSNGTRSNRALVGMSTGFLAIPGEQLMKRNKAQQDFFSIAKLLKPYNYETSFIYGGESRFDNMGNFFMGNSFHHVIEQSDFENPMYEGTWGVSDEDLFIKANNEFKKQYEQKQKFASLVFTLSSHAPFDIPSDKVENYIGEEPHLKTAVKYTDYALGKFFEMAKKEEYFKDTVFVVLADHNIRFTSSKINDMVPISEFQIPALIISQNLKPKKYNRIVTQPDILATALDLTGLDLKYPIIGNSIYSEKKKDFALVQFYDRYALLMDDIVTVLRPNKEPTVFKYINKKLIDSDLLDDKNAISLVKVIDYMYNNNLYK